MENPSEVQTEENVENFSDFLKDIKSKVKGEEPTDIKEKCLSLCQTFLAEQWTQLTIDDIEIKRLTGGMSNQMYYCRALNSSAEETQIKEVVIRLYGAKRDLKTLELIDQNMKSLNEAIVALTVSDNGLGPKLYGLFKEGQIQKHYQHTHVTEKDMKDEDLLLQLSCKLAKFHVMSPPLGKNESGIPRFLFGCSQKLEQMLVKKQNLFEEYNCKTLLDCNLVEELDWVLKLLKDLATPVVLCHGDFKFGNLMIINDKEIMLSDFEGSNYFYRGWDFTSIFTYLENVDKNTFEYKDESIVKAFISGYISEMEKLCGKEYSDNECNSVENIIREAKVLSLVYSMMLTTFFIFNTDVFKMPTNEQSCLKISENELIKYLAKKRVLIEMNII